MKKLSIPALLLIITVAGVKPARAQDTENDPGAYMNVIGAAETAMNKSYMAYISASAHSSRKRKIEKMRDQTVESILTCKYAINDVPAYKGDNSLKQSSLDYVQFCYKIFDEDYAHIVDLDDIAERSYDEMQAYLLLQQATNDSLSAAIARIDKAEKSFAAKYNVTIDNQQTELGEKMEEANKVSQYHDKVYLLFYKCNWEDSQLSDAVNQKNVTKIEEVRSALKNYAVEGLAVLDTLQAFENDPSLAETCKQALAFYKDEAETKIPAVTDFFLQEENFSKLKTAMDAKAASDRTQQDVDTYNKAVNDINAAVNVFNQTNTDLNNNRNDVNKNWADAERTFIDTHTPYYK